MSSNEKAVSLCREMCMQTWKTYALITQSIMNVTTLHTFFNNMRNVCHHFINQPVVCEIEVILVISYFSAHNLHTKCYTKQLNVVFGTKTWSLFIVLPLILAMVWGDIHISSLFQQPDLMLRPRAGESKVVQKKSQTGKAGERIELSKLPRKEFQNNIRASRVWLQEAQLMAQVPFSPVFTRHHIQCWVVWQGTDL